MIIKIAVLIIILILFFSFTLLYVNTHQPRYWRTTSPGDHDIAFEQVSFITSDEIELRGWFLRPGGDTPLPVIIIAHGLGASKSDFVGLGAYLLERRFNVLLFDFRAHGDSGGRACSLGLKEQDDIIAAIDYAVSRADVDAQRIGLYGFSLGGSVGILAAAADARIKALVADSPFSSLEKMSAGVLKTSYFLPPFPFLDLAGLFYRVLFGGWMDDVAPIKAIQGISPRPVLLIASDTDEMIPATHSRALFSAAGNPKEMWVIEGAAHGATMAVAQDSYYKKVWAFFKKSLHVQ